MFLMNKLMLMKLNMPIYFVSLWHLLGLKYTWLYAVANECIHMVVWEIFVSKIFCGY